MPALEPVKVTRRPSASTAAQTSRPCGANMPYFTPSTGRGHSSELAATPARESPIDLSATPFGVYGQRSETPWPCRPVDRESVRPRYRWSLSRPARGGRFRSRRTATPCTCRHLYFLRRASSVVARCGGASSRISTCFTSLGPRSKRRASDDASDGGLRGHESSRLRPRDGK